MSDLIAELQAAIDLDLDVPLKGTISALLDRITTLEKALAEAREALEPFARQAGEFHETWPDSMIPVCGIPEEYPQNEDNAKFTIGDLRRAARASTPLDGEGR